MTCPPLKVMRKRHLHRRRKMMTGTLISTTKAHKTQSLNKPKQKLPRKQNQSWMNQFWQKLLNPSLPKTHSMTTKTIFNQRAFLSKALRNNLKYLPPRSHNHLRRKVWQEIHMMSLEIKKNHQRSKPNKLKRLSFKFITKITRLETLSEQLQIRSLWKINIR